MGFRRQLALVGVASAVVAVCVTPVLLIAKEYRDFERIEKGMNKADVIKILGRPSSSSFGRWAPGGWVDASTWNGWSGQIRVCFSCPAPNLAGHPNVTEESEEEIEQHSIVFVKTFR